MPAQWGTQRSERERGGGWYLQAKGKASNGAVYERKLRMTALFLVRILLDANLSTGGLESLFLSHPDVLESHILFSLSNPCFLLCSPSTPLLSISSLFVYSRSWC